jgi:hypothetical protein
LNSSAISTIMISPKIRLKGAVIEWIDQALADQYQDFFGQLPCLGAQQKIVDFAIEKFVVTSEVVLVDVETYCQPEKPFEPGNVCDRHQ